MIGMVLVAIPTFRQKICVIKILVLTLFNVRLKFEKNHQQHIAVYGYALDERLTGAHETCSINEFKSGNSDRGASIRIPIATADKGYGYLEDRRPGANSDPYLVSARILVSVCELSESLMTVNQKTVVKAA